MLGTDNRDTDTPGSEPYLYNPLKRVSGVTNPTLHVRSNKPTARKHFLIVPLGGTRAQFEAP